MLIAVFPICGLIRNIFPLASQAPAGLHEFFNKIIHIAEKIIVAIMIKVSVCEISEIAATIITNDTVLNIKINHTVSISRVWHFNFTFNLFAINLYIVRCIGIVDPLSVVT